MVTRPLARTSTAWVGSAVTHSAMDPMARGTRTCTVATPSWATRSAKGETAISRSALDAVTFAHTESGNSSAEAGNAGEGSSRVDTM